MMKRTSALMMLWFAVVAPRASAEDRLNVVTTIETLADLSQRVGGDKVTVQSLSHGYQDPHYVEAKPSLTIALNRADVLVRVGLDLEIGWLPVLVTESRNGRIQPGQIGDIETSTFIEVLDIPTTQVTRAMGDIHPRGNPHFWIPPVNALRIAKGIMERFQQLRPGDKDYFQAQFDKFLAALKSKAPQWDAEAKPLAGLKIVTYHKSWTYVSKWLKLQEVSYVEIKPGIPPSPDHLLRLISLMKAEKVSAVLMEDYYNRSIAEEVASRTGAKLVPMPSDVGARPEIKTYFDLVDTVLGNLTRVIR
jgi:zinc/manganese transport system substrate-binding protein